MLDDVRWDLDSRQVSANTIQVSPCPAFGALLAACALPASRLLRTRAGLDRSECVHSTPSLPRPPPAGLSFEPTYVGVRTCRTVVGHSDMKRIEDTAAFLIMAARQLRVMAERVPQAAIELKHIAEQCETEAEDLKASAATIRPC